ncbi:MAG: Holliday junction resolvase [Patescibacteria group bacterium]|nr:Holliday junction resolvase [Patescibacteria group bacterium]
MATNYQRGRAFEYRVRDALMKRGAVYVMRAAQSKGKVDLLALYPGLGEMIPYVEIVQCKRDGRLSADEAAELIRIAVETDTVPLLAKTGKNGRGVEFINLLTEGNA